jgi:hypothetical protein
MFILFVRDDIKSPVEVSFHIIDKQRFVDDIQNDIVNINNYVECYPEEAGDMTAKLIELNGLINMVKDDPEYSFSQLVKMYGLENIVFVGYNKVFYTVRPDGIYNHTTDKLMTNKELEYAYISYKNTNVIHRPYIVLLYGQVVKGRDYGIHPRFIIKPATHK